MVRNCYWIVLLVPMSLFGKEFKAGGPELDKEAITCHLPEREHLPNAVGTDGFGLCVFTSLDMAARWSNEPALVGFRDFMTKYPGGGWPEKVDQFIPKMAAHQGLPTPGWVQHTGGDAQFLRQALKNGRYVCVTYDGRDGVFYRQRVAHMVNLVHFSDRFAVIQDNNFPGQWLWMAPADFLERWRGMGGGWAIALTKAGPPPIPMNLVGASVMPKAKPQALVSEDDNINFGVGLHALSDTSMYRVNGRRVNRDDALAALGKIPDDANRPRLTIVGDAKLRQQVVQDLETHPALAMWRERLVVQDYAPDHWAVADVGFAPGITFQKAPDPEGKASVVFRMNAYAGPDALAGALRKADPLYRPDRDPDPNTLEQPKATPAEAIWASLPTGLVWVGSAFVGAVGGWLLRRIKSPSIANQPKQPELRTLIIETLYDIVRGPTPPPATIPTNEDLRQKLQQLFTSAENERRSG